MKRKSWDKHRKVFMVTAAVSEGTNLQYAGEVIYTRKHETLA